MAKTVVLLLGFPTQLGGVSTRNVLLDSMAYGVSLNRPCVDTVFHEG